MKKRILSLILLASTAIIANAQVTKTVSPADTKAATETKEDAPAAVNPNAAEITFENDLHDYGTIKQGADGNYEFKFTNTGKETLVISNAKGSCGCTVPTWPKEPIKPGQSSSIKVHYDTNRVGAFSKTVTIASNAKTASKVISIKGNVEATPKDQTTPFKNWMKAVPSKEENNFTTTNQL